MLDMAKKVRTRCKLVGKGIVIVAEKALLGRAIARALAKAGTQPVFRNQWRLDIQTKDGLPCAIVYPNGHAFELVAPEDYDPAWAEWNSASLPICPPAGRFRRKPVNASLLKCISDAFVDAIEIVNACDAGREGELIFWELIEEIGVGDIDLKRMWITDTTANGLWAAYKARRDARDKKFAGLLKSAKARQAADWIWGINMTRYCTMAFGEGKTVSIGRVKTPLLGEIAKRAEKVDRFHSEPFYRIEIAFEGADKKIFRGMLKANMTEQMGHIDTMFRNEYVAMERAAMINADKMASWEVFDSPEEVNELPPAPFSLLELQRSAYRIFGWSPSYTSKVAQEAYSVDNSITYPRTESEFLPESMKEEAREIFRKVWAENVMKFYGDEIRRIALPQPGESAFVKRLNSDHHAIIPTGIIPRMFDEQDRYRDAYKLWDLVVRRFVCAMLEPAKVVALTRICIRKKDFVELRAIFKEGFVREPGWMVVERIIGNTRGYGKYFDERPSMRDYPYCKPMVAAAFATVKQGYTAPPDLYDEDMLLSWMKRRGLGTSATRAEILDDLFRCEYIEHHGKAILPTKEGFRVVEMLRAMDATEVLDPELTESWETTLENMARPRKGQLTVSPEEFALEVRDMAATVGGRLIGVKPEKAITLCPKTGRRVIEHETYFEFPGYPETQCPKVIASREMSADDYREIFVAGRKGGGPFEGFVARSGKPFKAKLIFVPKTRRFKFGFNFR